MIVENLGESIMLRFQNTNRTFCKIFQQVKKIFVELTRIKKCMKYDTKSLLNLLKIFQGNRQTH